MSSFFVLIYPFHLASFGLVDIFYGYSGKEGMRVANFNKNYIMKKNPPHLLLVPEFKKFIADSATGRRLLPSGKKIRKSTILQYSITLKILEEFETLQNEPIRIKILHRISLRDIQTEKKYWGRFFRNFLTFLYENKNCYDRYVTGVSKMIKAFFNYIIIEKGLPLGDFHKKFCVPASTFSPVALSPQQLRKLITDKEFENTLSARLRKTKDIFVFGCTVGLRCSDLLNLKKTNIQTTPEGVYAVLHTKKTGAEVKVPLPEYAIDIINRHKKLSGTFVLPQITSGNLNLHIKKLIKAAGWDYYLPKIRHLRGEPVEIKTRYGTTYKFYDHITIHTMRRTAITSLLLMGVDETSVRKISGHAPGSIEFYRYVAVVQDYLNAKIKAAHRKLLETEDFEEIK
jgi:integrase